MLGSLTGREEHSEVRHNGTGLLDVEATSDGRLRQDSYVPRSGDRRQVWTVLALIAGGLVFAALSGAALAWDGSVYLFQILDTRRPFIPHNRFINSPLHWPLVLISSFTSNLSVLQALFGLIYAAVSLGALAISWWIVRDRARSLFVWPLLSIGLATLAGQFNLVAEAYLAGHLAWPIVLALLMGMAPSHVPIVGMLALAVYLSHPHAILFFAFAALLALLIGLRRPEERNKMWFWAAGFGAAAIFAVVRLLTGGTAYEQEQMSSAILRFNLGVALTGLPLLALLCSFVAGAAIVAAPFVERHRSLRYGSAAYAIGLGSVLLATSVLVLWARDANQWQWANKFTTLTPFVTMAFLTLAAFESFFHGSDLLQRTEYHWNRRHRLMEWVAIGFLLVMVVQSTAWVGVTRRFRETIAASPWSCLSAAPIEWLDESPLNQFGTPALSLLLQGRAPEKVVLRDDACGEANFAEGLRLDQYSVRSWSGGWFDLRRLNERVLGDQEVPRDCSFALTTGWHQTETNLPFWWRWSDGQDARMRVLAEKDLNAALKGDFESFQQPNTVDVLVNGVRQTTIDVTWDGLKAFGPLPIKLRAGTNTIQFISRNQPVENEGRLLAIEVANLRMSSGDSDIVCSFHP